MCQVEVLTSVNNRDAAAYLTDPELTLDVPTFLARAAEAANLHPELEMRFFKFKLRAPKIISSFVIVKDTPLAIATDKVQRDYTAELIAIYTITAILFTVVFCCVLQCTASFKAYEQKKG